jgi:RNA polymerase sigma-70 factor (ECF subfamily)
VVSRELPPDKLGIGEDPSAESSALSPAETQRSVPERLEGARLVEDHFDFIWRTLRRFGLTPEDADDVAQQVFMTATQKIDEIAPRNARTYVYGVALRVSANLKRKAHRRREEAGLDLGEFRDAAALPDDAAELGAARELLDELLSGLTPELRRVFVLANVEQFELAEIAELEGIPQGTAASRLRRARAAFAERLARARERAPFRET